MPPQICSLKSFLCVLSRDRGYAPCSGDNVNFPAAATPSGTYRLIYILLLLASFQRTQLLAPSLGVRGHQLLACWWMLGHLLLTSKDQTGPPTDGIGMNEGEGKIERERGSLEERDAQMSSRVCDPDRCGCLGAESVPFFNNDVLPPFCSSERARRRRPALRRHHRRGGVSRQRHHL